MVIAEFSLEEEMLESLPFFSDCDSVQVESDLRAARFGRARQADLHHQESLEPPFSTKL
jgi:hypothetical protein